MLPDTPLISYFTMQTMVDNDELIRLFQLTDSADPATETGDSFARHVG